MIAIASQALSSVAERLGVRRRGGVVAPTVEMRRFTAGMRAVTALLCSILLTDQPRVLTSAAVVVLVAYDLWTLAILWCEANGRPAGRTLSHFWIDVTWIGVMLLLVDGAEHMLILAAVQPVLFVAVGYRVRHGVLLACYAAAWVVGPIAVQLLRDAGAGTVGLAHGLAAMVPVVGVALLAAPVRMARRRMDLMRETEMRLDARRGLISMATTLIDGLRRDLAADFSGIVLPAASEGPALLCTAEEGVFAANPAVHAKLEALLAAMPPCAVTHVTQHPLPWAGGTRLHGPVPDTPDRGLHDALSGLCALLEVCMLAVVPLQRYERRHGYLLVGRRSVWAREQEVQALSAAMPMLARIIEQAHLVDRLVRETAAHERVRIGRDLHDSAIQPYLGLRYALDALARRVASDNPLRPEIESLTQLVEVEIDNLRDIVTGLRNGEPAGDNALVPAVRRQVRHFGELFGVDVELDCPDQLLTSRAMAGAVFYMVNEALNNVRRHTPARRVQVGLRLAGSWLCLRVRDDGGSVRGAPAPDFLPRSLSERVQSLGGNLAVMRPDGVNTELVIHIPLHADVKH